MVIKMIAVLKKIRDLIIRAFESDDPISNAEKIKKAGAQVGTNVHIYSSMIDPTCYKMISIGDNVTITNATILCHDASTKKFIGVSKLRNVDIGNNVFIGYGSIILPGVHIGNNVIVGAGSVVRKDIPDDSIVLGNPAVVICNTSEYINKNKKEFEKKGLSKANELSKDACDKTFFIE